MLNIKNSLFKKKFLNENINFNNKNKKYERVLYMQEEEESKFLENFNKIKHKLNNNDIQNINNWDSYKKKNKENNFIIKKKIVKKKPISINARWYNLLCSNLNKSSKEIGIVLNSSNFLNLEKIYNKFNFLNVYKINRKNYSSFGKSIYIIIDLRKLKSIIIAKLINKHLITLSNGIIFKKMNLTVKKYKKSAKLTVLALKNLLLKLNFLKNFKTAFIYIKGLGVISNSIVEYAENTIKINNKLTNLILINSYKISNNNDFKLKRVKSIKRKLKKKILKLK